uniref:ribosomal protein L20 n=1 Tax=Ochrosphaera neapolitana TaxID=35137 RepID=UPI00286AED2E|nr:ribosomal protein L20 [Ochrosphaera neapolitana]WKK50110.1 ribosomal protein L20 [Ochrosphaera neapolitana]
MVRIKRGNVARSRRKKILKLAKGFKGSHSRLFRTANGQVMKALVYSYVGRKRRKRDFKRLWICRINAASHQYNLTYSRLKSLLKKSSIKVNLKMLAQIAILDKSTFNSIVEKIKL